MQSPYLRFTSPLRQYRNVQSYNTAVGKQRDTHTSARREQLIAHDHDHTSNHSPKGPENGITKHYTGYKTEMNRGEKKTRISAYLRFQPLQLGNYTPCRRFARQVHRPLELTTNTHEIKRRDESTNIDYWINQSAAAGFSPSHLRNRRANDDIRNAIKPNRIEYENCRSTIRSRPTQSYGNWLMCTRMPSIYTERILSCSHTQSMRPCATVQRTLLGRYQMSSGLQTVSRVSHKSCCVFRSLRLHFTDLRSQPALATARRKCMATLLFANWPTD